MRKTGFIGLIVFLLSGMSLVAQQQPDYRKVEIKVQKVSGSVYMLEGMGGNAFGCWQQTKSRLFGEEERLSSTNLPFAFSSVSLRNTFEAIRDFGDSPLRCLGE